MITPIQEIDNFFFKRDDYYTICNSNGGKSRSAYYLVSKSTKEGITSAGSRSSPQLKILSNICQELKKPFVAHTTTGELDENLKCLFNNSYTTVIQHKYGYNSVIIKRAKDCAKENNYEYIPFGMETEEAVNQTSKQVENLKDYNIKRIIVPLGSGMSFCGIAKGLLDFNLKIPIIGVQVGANPTKRLEKYFPDYNNYEIIESTEKYSTKIKNNIFCGVELNPNYEAKCIPFLKESDLLWIVGR